MQMNDTSQSSHLMKGILLTLTGMLITEVGTTKVAPVQLTNDIRPSLYQIELVPHAEQLNFEGKESITIKVAKTTNQIVLNAIDLNVNSAVIASENNKSRRQTLTVSKNDQAQTLTFTSVKPIPAGDYQLTINYQGIIGTQAVGLFALDYQQDNKAQRALFTQFENSDARRMFPSFDEPAFKARYKLSAIVDKNLLAVSNMPVETVKKIDANNQKVTFGVTPIMSSYLLFFAVGDFERLTDHLGKTELGVVARRGSVSQAKYALEQSKIILDKYQKYFGIPYPLPKLDNVAAPGQSQFFGAMENWGAIFTFDYALLVDPKMSTSSDVRSIFSTEAHEIAHQWFGDLVTMNWWDDIWLNEGFASWMESRTTTELHPEWQTELNIVGLHEAAMGQDAITGTHPVVQHITNVEQAASAFDAITYSKGASVINMLENYVGAEVWRKGVSNHLKNHAYSNAESDELWKSIDSVSSRPITSIAHAFTLQPGVPLIAVDSLTCKDGNTEVLLSQREFTLDRPNKEPGLWPVPVVASIVGNPTERTLVENRHGVLHLKGCGTLVVNAGQNGYFRTTYPSTVLADISKNIAKVAPVDQLGLISDRWALGVTEVEPLTEFMRLIQNIPTDANDKVISKIASNLSNLDTYYSTGEARDRFHRFAIKLLSPKMQQLGFQPKSNEPVTASELRSQLFGVLSSMGDPEVLAQASRLYEAAKADAMVLPPSIRKSVLRIVAENADAKTWEEIHQLSIKESSPSAKDFYYVLLASARDESLAQRALALALTNEPGATVCASMVRAVSRLHPQLAFDFVLAHRDEVMAKVDNSSAHRFIPGLITSSNDAALADRLEQDAREHDNQGPAREVNSAVALVRLRAGFAAKQLPVIDQWLKLQNQR